MMRPVNARFSECECVVCAFTETESERGDKVKRFMFDFDRTKRGGGWLLQLICSRHCSPGNQPQKGCKRRRKQDKTKNKICSGKNKDADLSSIIANHFLSTLNKQFLALNLLHIAPQTIVRNNNNSCQTEKSSHQTFFLHQKSSTQKMSYSVVSSSPDCSLPVMYSLASKLTLQGGLHLS